MKLLNHFDTYLHSKASAVLVANIVIHNAICQCNKQIIHT